MKLQCACGAVAVLVLLALDGMVVRGEDAPALAEVATGSGARAARPVDGSPSEQVVARTENGTLRFDVRPQASEASIRVLFRQPATTTGKERLLLEGRSEESSGLGLCVARVMLLDAKGGAVATYEPDLLFPPEWNLREILFRDFDRPPPEQVAGVEMRLWAPNEAGKHYTVYLRRCEFWSTAQVTAALLTNRDRPRAPLPPAASPVTEADRRWTSFGPGGGGWYRTMAISPHDGSCFIGADVGGIYRSADQCRTWEIVNTGIPNLYVNAIAFHPTDRRVVFAGSNGGVLKSTDGGATWQIKRNGFPPLMTFGESAPISAVAASPWEPDTVYAGVGHERGFGELDKKTRGGRIYRSTDGGETWQLFELPGGEACRSLSVFGFQFHPRDRVLLYASTQGGLFRSADGGRSWQKFGRGLEGHATTFLSIQRDAPEVMLLAYSRGPDGRSGVLKSTDGGNTWTPIREGLRLNRDVTCWRLIAHPRDPRTFYLATNYALFASPDAGVSWQPLNRERGGNIRSAWFFEGANVTGIAIDPRNPERIVYCNDMDLYQTMDGGKTWDQVATDLVRPATADSPAVWRGRGCEVLCMGGPQALAVDPSNPRTLYFGYWDTHAWKSEDGGRTCYRLTNGIHSGYGRMGCVALDPADPDIVYMSVGRNYDQQRIYKSVNGGRQFHVIGHEGTGLPPGGVFSLVIDPDSPPASRTLYAAVTGYGVYKSEDGGLSWREQSHGLPQDSRKPLQLAMDPKNSRRLFLASGAHYHPDTKVRGSGYIARTEDGGVHWQVLKDRIEPQCILIDPFDSRKIYAGNRNFSGADYPRAFSRSDDGGDTWTSLNQDMFLKGPGSRDGDQGARVYVSCLAGDPARPGTLYAGCTEESYDVSNGRGVFRSTDWGQTWEPFPLTGLANYRIGTLVVDPVNPSRLYVGTGGNGVFRWGPPP